ncbi:MAG: hypothetical protein ACPGVU_17660 [Limisphaerales bacterium]
MALGFKKLFGGGSKDEPEPNGPCLEEEGKPTLRLPEHPEEVIERVHRLTKDSMTRDRYTSYIGALYEVVVRGDVSPGIVCDLVNGISCPHKLLRDEAGEQLMQLAHYYPEVAGEFQRIMEQEGEAVRLNLVKAVFKVMPPRTIAINLLFNGLRDQAERVRYFSVDRIRACQLRELLPQLHEQRRVEPNLKMQRFIDFNCAMMTDGFYVEEKDSGDYLVSAALGGGGVLSATVPIDEYSPAKVQETLERLRTNWARLQGKKKD